MIPTEVADIQEIILTQLEVDNGSMSDEDWAEKIAWAVYNKLNLCQC